MTKLLDQAIARIRELPDEEQDELATMLVAFIEGLEAYGLSKDQAEEVARRQADLREGRARLADDDEDADLWVRCGI